MYCWFVVGLSCPSHSAITLMSTPDCSRCTTVEWRTLCGEMARPVKLGIVRAAACTATEPTGVAPAGTGQFRNDMLLTQHGQQVPEAGLQIVVRTQCRRMAITSGQLRVQELLDQRLIDLIGVMANGCSEMIESMVISSCVGSPALCQRRLMSSSRMPPRSGAKEIPSCQPEGPGSCA